MVFGMTRNETTETTRPATWYYKPDGKGAFDVFHHDPTLDKYPEIKDARVLTGVSEAKAKAHVKFAEESDKARDRFLMLANPHFAQNWKMATKRIIYPDREGAESVAEALSFFLGGAEVKPVEDGFEVGSLGYYHYVGA